MPKNINSEVLGTGSFSDKLDNIVLDKKNPKTDITSAKTTIMKMVNNAEFLASKTHHISKGVQKVVKESETLNNFEQKTKVIKHILRHFKQGQEEDFYKKSVPLLLENSGFEKDSNIYKVATSKIAGKTMSALKPITFSVLSYYARKNAEKIPEENPFKIEEYPRLHNKNDDESIISSQSGSDQKKEFVERFAGCAAICCGELAETIDSISCFLTQPVEDKIVSSVNQAAAKFLPNDQEYANLRNVLLEKGGIKKLYKEIFPHESKVKEATSLDSKKDVESYIEKTFSEEKSKNNHCITM